MDFFQQQDIARRKTGLLIAYFLLAVVLIIVAVYLAIAVVLRLTEPSEEPGGALALSALWDPQLFAMVAAGTAALISGGSLYKIAALSGGGHTVAELLGGRLLHPETTDPDERRVLNVVEEMAIAAGTPVPPVYLLDKEEGINAFAAGHSPKDAIVAVTRGCVRWLSRDELQGVVAHEFSHILNGDMRLNLRLMGILFGILLIGLTGWILFRSSTGVRVRLGARDDDRRGGNPLPLIGLALYIIGYVGVFFGNLIKAAVSRQREFLADAAAVQFTRNPDGIAGALKKIGALAEGSTIREPRAEEASHMFFGEAIDGVSTLFGLLASHPPLVERIRRIDPSFDGDFSQVRLAPPAAPATAAGADTATPGRGPRPRVMQFNPTEALARVGTVAPMQLVYAAGLLDELSPTLAAQVRDPLGAQATVFALLLDSSEPVRQAQLAWLNAHALPAVARETRKLLPEAHRLVPEARLPLVELAVPALRQMSPGQVRDFIAGVQAIVEADRQVTLFEYALQKLLLRHLVTSLVRNSPPRAKHTTAAALVEPTAVVLSALARCGQASPEGTAHAFEAGVQALGWSGARLELSPPEAIDLNALDAALKTLDAATPPLKKQILLACAACIGADGRVTVEESELLRAIADSLDCPMPPLLGPGEPTSPAPAVSPQGAVE
jgi:Zn-dependent protease with chaperone function